MDVEAARLKARKMKGEALRGKHVDEITCHGLHFWQHLS
jgi:hypothetical protein